jgi:hypothetical protein
MNAMRNLKKTGLCFAFCMALSALSAQEIIHQPNKTGQYCAVLKDGAIMLMKDGTAVTEPVTLMDGSKITKDGTVLRKDGSKVPLKNEECIDMNGNITAPERENKIQQPKKP